MSKDNRTLLDFNNNLDEEYAWRIKELLLLKSKIPKDNNLEQLALIKSALTMLYAHWEGFVKASASHFLNFVSLRRLKLEELQSNFIALCIKSKLNLFSSNKFKLHKEAVDFILKNLETRSFIPYKTEIDTKSNLTFSVFNDICYLLNLEVGQYSIYSQLINSLSKKRNNIAHGKYIITDFSEFMKFYDSITEIMNLFKNDLYNSAQLEKYKKFI